MPSRSASATSEQSQASRRAVSGAIPGPSAIAQSPPPGIARARQVGRQGRGVDVHEDLVALAARQAGGRSRERGLGERGERSALVGDGGRGDGRRFRGTARLNGGKRLRGTVRGSSASAHAAHERVASGLEGPQKERAVLRRELGVDLQAAVVVVPVPAQKLSRCCLVGLGER